MMNKVLYFSTKGVVMNKINKLQRFVLVTLFVLASSLSGCLAVHAEEKRMCIKEKEAFADMVAKKVVELQKQQECKASK